VLFEEGQHVDAGQVLVRIEKTDLNARRQQVESGLLEARAVLKNAEVQVGRMRNLYREKAVPKQILDEAETAFVRAQSGVASAEGMLKEVDANLGYASVSSPLKGVVVRKYVEQGDMAAPGAPLFSVEQQDPMKVIVDVGEQDLPHIQISQPAVVVFEAFGNKEGRSLTGQVETIIPSADPRSRTFQVRVVLNNTDGLLQSGMFVRVQFHKNNRPGVLIPVQAVVHEGQLQGVYVIDNNRVHLKWVRLGKTFGERVEVISGLQAGELIAISGLKTLRDGSKVEVAGNA
jgi:RND family efflux transporter MFP subunit